MILRHFLVRFKQSREGFDTYFSRIPWTVPFKISLLCIVSSTISLPSLYHDHELQDIFDHLASFVIPLWLAYPLVSFPSNTIYPGPNGSRYTHTSLESIWLNLSALLATWLSSQDRKILPLIIPFEDKATIE